MSFLRKPWRIVKFWQTSNYELLLACSFLGIRSSEAPVKKFYVLIDAKQESFGVRVFKEKPNIAVASGAFSQIWRKNFQQPVIEDLVQDEASGNIFLKLLTKSDQKPSWILCRKSRPPELLLINEEFEILLSYGVKGTFTKRRPMPSEPFDELDKNPSFDLKQVLMAGWGEAQDDNNLPSESEDKPKFQTRLAQKLKRKLKALKKSVERIRCGLPSSKAIVELERNARLLQAYLYMVKEGDYQLQLDKHLSGTDHDLIIPLDPELNPGANLESYFISLKKMRKAKSVGEQLLSKQTVVLSRLEADRELLSTQLLSEQDCLEIARRYELSFELQKVTSKEVSVGYRSFFSSQGYSILVGKGPKENDELTKSARSNDYWFHAAGVAGSHVIVPVKPEIRIQAPESLLREAAILAIHYSKYKSDLAGEVYVARKSEISKQKGMPPGLWNVERCKTLFIRYSKEELDTLLATSR